MRPPAPAGKWLLPSAPAASGVGLPPPAAGWAPPPAETPACATASSSNPLPDLAPRAGRAHHESRSATKLASPRRQFARPNWPCAAARRELNPSTRPRRPRCPAPPPAPRQCAASVPQTLPGSARLQDPQPASLPRAQSSPLRRPRPTHPATPQRRRAPPRRSLREPNQPAPRRHRVQSPDPAKTAHRACSPPPPRRFRARLVLQRRCLRPSGLRSAARRSSPVPCFSN